MSSIYIKTRNWIFEKGRILKFDGFIICNLRKYLHLRELAGTSWRQIRRFGHSIRGMHFFDTSEKYLEHCSVGPSRFTYNSDCKISFRPVIICFSSLRQARIWHINVLFIEHWQPQNMFHLERLNLDVKSVMAVLWQLRDKYSESILPLW